MANKISIQINPWPKNPFAENQWPKGSYKFAIFEQSKIIFLINLCITGALPPGGEGAGDHDSPL